jgi:sulfatase maturation enzyme AslB (radical SAM superfamily)
MVQLATGCLDNKGGQGSFDQVMQGWRALASRNVDVNILCTVHNANGDHPLEVYRFFRDEIGAKYVQFIPIVERVTSELLPIANMGWGERGSDPRPLYITEGHHVTDRSVGSEQWGRFLIEIFDEWIRFDVGKVFVQMFDAALASWVVNSEQQRAFGDAKRDTLPRNRFTETPDGESGPERRRGAEAFFDNVDRPMRPWPICCAATPG